MHARLRFVSFALCVAAAGCSNPNNFLVDTGTDTQEAGGSDATDVPRIDVPRDLPVESASETGSDAIDVSIDAVDASDVVDASDANDVQDASDVSDTVDAADAPADATDVQDAGDAADAMPAQNGQCTPTIDGNVTTDWPANAWRTDNLVASMWATNDLYTLRVCYDDTNLYVGIEGDVQAMNAIVLYLDQDYGAATGITDPTMLNDHVTSNTTDLDTLDGALSAPFTSWPSGFGAEWAWGTVGMQTKSAGTTSDLVGLRDIHTAPMDFGWFGDDHTACSLPGGSDSCEVSIPWSRIYGGARPAGSHLAMFVRLDNALGTEFSNQTLPQDDATMPQVVSQVLDFAPTP